MRITTLITLFLLLAFGRADSPRRGGVLKQLQTRPANQLDLYNQLSGLQEHSIKQHNWLMDGRYFRHLSMPVRAYLLKRYAQTNLQTNPQQIPSSPENIRVNDPTLDSADRTQSGTTAVAAGDRLVISFNNSAGISNGNISGYAYSRDGGKSWRQGFIPTYVGGANLGSGVLTIAPDGSFLHACVAEDRDGIVSIAVSRSRDGGQSWSRPVNASSSAAGQNVFHDKPWITADRSSDSFNSNRVFVVWTTLLQSSGKTRIQLARSKDGREFKKAQIIAESSQGSFVQAPTVAVGPRGEVYIVWLEGEFGRSQLKLAKSVDGGKTFGGPTVIAGFVNPAFPANGIFDANSFPSLAVDTSRRASRGHVYVVYAARPDNRADRADAYLLRSTDGGSNWSAPYRLNDDTGIAEQMLPSVAVTDDGAVGASWYDRRNDPINLSLLDIYATVSTDGGTTFLPNKRITTANWPLVPTPFNLRGGYHGDYHQLGVDGRRFIFNWADDRNGSDSDVYVSLHTAAELAEKRPDFLLAARTSYRIIQPGGRAVYAIDIQNIDSGAGSLEFTAISNRPGLRLQVSDKLAGPRPMVLLEVESGADTEPGAYFLTVIGRRDGKERSTSVRLTVLEDSLYLQVPVNVTLNPSGSILGRSSIQPDGSINIVWFDDSTGLYSTFFTRSTDGGKTFSRPIMFPRNQETFIGTPVIASNASTIYVAYLELFEQPEFVFKTMLTRSTDGGNTFSTPVSVSENRDLLIVNESFQMDADGSLHFGCTSLRPVGQAQLYESYDLKSTDGGRTFIEQRIYSSRSPLSIPILVLDGDSRTLRSIFIDFDRERGGLLFTRSTDGGKTFSTPSKIPANTNRLLFASAWFGFDGRTDTVYIEGDINREEFALYYSGADSSDRFGPAVKVSGDVATTLSAGIATDLTGSRIVIAFEGSENRYLDEEYLSRVYWCNSTDGGKSFTPPTAFPTERGGDFNPFVLLDLRGELSIIYSGIRNGTSDLLYSPSPDGGLTFPAPLNLTDSPGASGYSDLVYTPDGKLQLLFLDNSGGSFDIYRTVLGKP